MEHPTPTGRQELSEPENTEFPREEAELPVTKICVRCNQSKPLSHFKRRTGRRSGSASRRNTCRACRRQAEKRKVAEASGSAAAATTAASDPTAPVTLEPRRRIKRPPPPAPPKPEGPDSSVLRTTREGIVRMRGVTDKGRRWYQETDLDTAVTLVKEFAAVVVNPYTIRRIYSNKKFRRYILTRDRYTCYYCGEYGDTIDHLLPRAKGGHTTPLNCVCACSLCNQSKADRSLDDFMEGAQDEPAAYPADE